MSTKRVTSECHLRDFILSKIFCVNSLWFKSVPFEQYFIIVLHISIGEHVSLLTLLNTAVYGMKNILNN